MDDIEWDMVDGTSSEESAGKRSRESYSDDVCGPPPKKLASAPPEPNMVIDASELEEPAPLQKKLTQLILPYLTTPKCVPRPASPQKKLKQLALSFSASESFLDKAKKFTRELNSVLQSIGAFEEGRETSNTELGILFGVHPSWIEFFTRVDGSVELTKLFRDLRAFDEVALKEAMIFTKLPLSRARAFVILCDGGPWRLDSAQTFGRGLAKISPRGAEPMSSPDGWVRRGVVLLSQCPAVKGTQLMKAKWAIFWTIFQEYVQELYHGVVTVHVGSKKKTRTKKTAHISTVEEASLLSCLQCDLYSFLVA